MMNGSSKALRKVVQTNFELSKHSYTRLYAKHCKDCGQIAGDKTIILSSCKFCGEKKESALCRLALRVVLVQHDTFGTRGTGSGWSSLAAALAPDCNRTTARSAGGNSGAAGEGSRHGSFGRGRGDRPRSRTRARTGISAASFCR